MDDDGELLFEVETRVKLTRAVRRAVTDIKDREVRSRLDDVQLTISNPDEVRRSVHNEATFLYYRIEGTRQLVCAVTRSTDGQTARVGMIYSTNRMKPGELLWPR